MVGCHRMALGLGPYQGYLGENPFTKIDRNQITRGRGFVFQRLLVEVRTDKMPQKFVFEEHTNPLLKLEQINRVITIRELSGRVRFFTSRVFLIPVGILLSIAYLPKVLGRMKARTNISPLRKFILDKVRVDIPLIPAKAKLIGSLAAVGYTAFKWKEGLDQIQQQDDTPLFALQARRDALQAAVAYQEKDDVAYKLVRAFEQLDPNEATKSNSRKMLKLIAGEPLLFHLLSEETIKDKLDQYLGFLVKTYPGVRGQSYDVYKKQLIRQIYESGEVNKPGVLASYDSEMCLGTFFEKFNLKNSDRTLKSFLAVWTELLLAGAKSQIKPSSTEAEAED